MKVLFSILVFGLLFAVIGHADEAQLGLVDKFVAFGDKVMALLSGNSGGIGAVLAFLFLLSKRLSNDKAGMIVSKIQLVFDAIAKLCEMIGKIAMRISQFLADAIKSDGILGKQ